MLKRSGATTAHTKMVDNNICGFSDYRSNNSATVSFTLGFFNNYIQNNLRFIDRENCNTT